MVKICVILFLSVYLILQVSSSPLKNSKRNIADDTDDTKHSDLTEEELTIFSQLLYLLKYFLLRIGDLPTEGNNAKGKSVLKELKGVLIPFAETLYDSIDYLDDKISEFITNGDTGSIIELLEKSLMGRFSDSTDSNDSDSDSDESTERPLKTKKISRG